MVQKFDEHIILSAEHLYERFGKENGYDILKPYFDKIEWRQYEDYLVVPEPESLIAMCFRVMETRDSICRTGTVNSAVM